MILSTNILLLPILAALSATPAHSATALAEARSAVEKWVETRQLISKTRTDWQADKETLEQTLKLYERELAALDEQMSNLGTNSVQVEKERSETEARKGQALESLERTKQFATELEAEMARLAPRFPTPLQDSLKSSLNRMPTDGANTRMTAAERAQVIVGILNEIDKFNSGVAIFSERRKIPAGEEVAVETVYVGLGAAYFVNEANDFAGTGMPGPKGWEWEIKPELASAVREVIRIYRDERPARFVALPAVIR